MAGRKGYKRGIALFLFISVATFTLMFLFGDELPEVRKLKKLTYIEDDSSVGKTVSLKLQTLLSNHVVLDKRSATKSIEKLVELDRIEIGMGGIKRDIYLSFYRGGKYERKNGGYNITGEFSERIVEFSGAQINEQNIKKFADQIIKLFPPQIYRPSLLSSLSTVSLWALLLALVLWLISLLADSYLVRVLLRAMDDDMPFMQCIYTILGYEFLNAVTPFQSGGQPLLVYIMHRNNVSVGKGILIAFFKTAGQIYFFAFLAPVVIFFMPELISIPSLTAFYIYGIMFFGYFLTLTFFVLFKPDAAKRLSLRIFSLLKKIKYFRRMNLSKGLRKTIKEINIFSYFTKTILKKKKLTVIWLFLLTAFAWTVKFMIAVAVIWGLGVFSVNIVQALSVQTVTNFIAFFAPTPGASGVFEFSMKKVFETVLENKESLLVFVLLWRFFSYYLSVIFGGLVVVKVLKIKQTALDAEEDMIDEEMHVPADRLSEVNEKLPSDEDR